MTEDIHGQCSTAGAEKKWRAEWDSNPRPQPAFQRGTTGVLSPVRDALTQDSSLSLQLPLPDAPRFDGSDYLPWRDDERLTGQLRRIYDVVKDGRWYTLPELEQRTGDPQASISAQLRHLRKERFGSHTVEREHVANGLFRYRVTR